MHHKIMQLLKKTYRNRESNAKYITFVLDM
jgi:hypothetical protein